MKWGVLISTVCMFSWFFKPMLDWNWLHNTIWTYLLSSGIIGINFILSNFSNFHIILWVHLSLLPYLLLYPKPPAQHNVLSYTYNAAYRVLFVSKMFFSLGPFTVYTKSPVPVRHCPVGINHQNFLGLCWKYFVHFIMPMLGICLVWVCKGRMCAATVTVSLYE